jgi:C4-type Zn-finger protein
MATKIEIRDILPPGDDCMCGRKLGDLHCPHCGCATVRGLPSRTNEAVLPNGNVLVNKCYVCRKCGSYFDDVARTSCTAPAKQLGRPSKAAAAAADLEEIIQKTPSLRETLTRLGHLQKEK